jgi:hypothetical protein
MPSLIKKNNKMLKFRIIEELKKYGYNESQIKSEFLPNWLQDDTKMTPNITKKSTSYVARKADINWKPFHWRIVNGDTSL